MYFRENCGLAYAFLLTIDSMGVYTSVKACSVKLPNEKSVACHMLWLRELLLRQVLSQLRWSDTRDMTADGHTKGQVDRSGLLRVMSGTYKFAHAVAAYPPTVKQPEHVRAVITETTHARPEAYNYDAPQANFD